MAPVTVNIEENLVEKFIAATEGSGNASNLIAEFIEWKLSQVQRELNEILQELKALEDKYQLSTAAFQERWEAGSLIDSDDFLSWAGLIELQEQRLALLSRLQ